MAKRLGGSNFFKQNDTKKMKFDVTENTNVNEEIWGDEFNIDQVEECIFQATQALKEQSFQVPSSFNDFNKSVSKITSTQNNDVIRNNKNNLKFPTFTNKDLAVPSTSRDTVNCPTIKENNKPNFNPKFDFQNTTENIVAKHFKFNRNSSTDDFNANQTLICKNDAKNVPEELLAEIERLKLENKKILEKCTTEQGEVSILRYQLKQAEKKVENVRMEKMQMIEKQKHEWTEKICNLNKNLNSMQSDLELKNLEITSLKERCKTLESVAVRKVLPSLSQQVEKYTRENDDFPPRVNSTLNNVLTKAQCYSRSIQTESKMICHNFILRCPLQNEIPEEIFNSTKYLTEKNMIKKYENICKNSADNDTTNMYETSVNLRFISTKMENEQPLSIDYIFSDLSKLMNLSETDIDSDKNMKYLNKIAYACQEILLNTLHELEKQKIVTKDLNFYVSQQFYMPDIPDNSSLFNSSPLIENEYSIMGRQFTMILSVLVKYSDYLANFISGRSVLQNANIDFEDCLKYFIQLNKFQSHVKNQKFVFLQLILILSETIRNRNFENYCTGLLIGVLKILTNSFYKTRYDLEGIKYIFQIIKEIVFCCPTFSVLFYVTELIEQCSNDVEFLKLFCQNSNKDYFVRDKDKVTFTNDSCLLQHFTLQLQNFISKTYTKLWISLRQVELFSNIIFNQFLKLKWASIKDDSECQCAINLLECYFKYINASVLYYNNCKYYFKEQNILLHIKHIYERVILMFYILSYTKGTIIFKLFTIYCQNIHILIQLQDELQFDVEFKNILKELEDDIDYQTTLKENEVFLEENSMEITEQLVNNLTIFV